jgi:tetratricopeptide (TPR) repeat protein
MTRTLILALALAAGAPAGAATPQDEARAEFEAGRAAFRAGDFAAARGRFERAYALDPSPVLLYNLARACEESGDAERASTYFRQYLEREPNADDRADVERRIRVMEAIVARERAAREAAAAKEAAAKAAAAAEPPPAAQEPPPAVTDEAAPGWLAPASWAAVGVGVAALGAATWFGLEAGAAEDAHAEATTGRAKQDAADDAERNAALANVGFAVGGALVVAGAVGLFLGLEDGGPTAAASPSGFGLGWSGRF